MPNLYLGALSELEIQLSRDVAAAKCDDSLSPVIVVVENNLAGVYLRRALTRLIGSHCRVRFAVLSDLAAELARQAGVNSQKEPFPLFAEQWLAVQTARQAAGGCFDPVSGRPGFSAALQQTFSELVDAGLDSLPPIRGGDQKKICELQRLYEYYRARIGSFASRSERYKLALGSIPPREPFRLLIYGGYRFSPIEWELVESLVRCSALAASVYWQEQALRFAAVQKLQERYLGCGLTLRPLSSPGKRAGGNLMRLQQELFNPAADPSNVCGTADSSVQFICASDEVQETQFITQAIINLAREGALFRDIAVMVHDPAYACLLKEQFAAAGIPYYAGGGRSLGQSRVGRGLLLFLDLIGSEYTRPRVMELITYAPFDFERCLKTVQRVNPAYWEFLSRDAGVVKTKEQWYSALKRTRELLPAAPSEKLKQTGRQFSVLPDPVGALEQLQCFLKELFEAAERFPSRGSWAAFSGACRLFVESFFHAGEECAAVLQLLHYLRVLDRCGDEAGLAEARQLLELALQSSIIPEGRFQQDGVNIIPAAAAAGIRFKIVFIPGLVDRGVPAPLQPDPLLPEPERRAMHGLLPMRRQKLWVEALNFTRTVHAASERVILSWPRTGAADSSEQLPSSYLFRAGEALLGRRLGLKELDHLPGYTRLVASPFSPCNGPAASVLEFDLQCLTLLAKERQGERYLKRLSPWLERMLDSDQSFRRAVMTPYQGMFTPGGAGSRQAREVLAPFGRTIAVTALEQYARCPFLFYLNNLLLLEPMEEPGLTTALSPKQRGLLLHRILETFCRQAAVQDLLPPARSPERCRLLLAEVCREQFSQAAEAPTLQPLFWKLEQRIVLESLQAFLEWEIKDTDCFKAEYLELPFGVSEKPAPVELLLPGGKVLRLRGRIDRVDRCGERVRVIDYKTGSKPIRDDNLEGGTALQLPVYLLAAKELLGLSGLEEASALACYLSPWGVKTAAYSGQGWSEKEQIFRETLEVLSLGLFEGRYFPYPGKQGEHCRSCRYRSLCGPRMMHLFARKSKDPALQSFLNLKEREPGTGS